MTVRTDGVSVSAAFTSSQKTCTKNDLWRGGGWGFLMKIYASKIAFQFCLSLDSSIFSVHHSKDTRIVLGVHECTAATMKC